MGVNILGAHQQEWRRRSPAASQGPGRKFDGVTWTVRDGLPYLPGSAAWMAGRVARHVDGGDHILLVVSVEQAQSSLMAPLVYARRTFGTHSLLAAA